MKAGLLGRKLGHSLSPQIHRLFGDYEYELYEREPDEVEAFVRSGELDFFNVTIPYKQDVFRLCDALTRNHAAKVELFRRVCLNVRLHNRDDHLKNFAFLMDAKGVWRLAPFFDFTRSEGPNGWQTLSVAGEGRNPSDVDLRRLADRVGLDASLV